MQFAATWKFLFYILDIAKLLNRYDQQRNEMEEVQELVSKTLQKYQTYYDKMQTHEGIVSDMEKDDTAKKDLSAQRKENEMLKQQSKWSNPFQALLSRATFRSHIAVVVSLL